VGTNSHSAQTIANALSHSSNLDLVPTTQSLLLASCRKDIDFFALKVFHVGDLSYANGRQPVWDTYGEMIEQLGI